MEKKEAEEYIAIQASERHPIVKKYLKSKHFLKYAIKLIVPDFLIGHPNLWDNLKILRKHPQFKPMRMALTAWMIFTITFGAFGIYSLNQAVRVFAVSPVTDTFTDETKIDPGKTNITVDTGAGQVKLSVWACGGALVDSRDGKSYATVLIGSQCWMAQYINVGTKIAGTVNQTNNATIEKYCYSNSEAICTSDGGLYQFPESRQYAASCNGTGAPPNDACSTPVVGICPAGWHIPSHYEYTTLERAVCTSGTCATDFPYNTTTTQWRGTDEGTKLQIGGSSGFEGLRAGHRSSDGAFHDRYTDTTNYGNTYANIWSSSDTPTAGYAWMRILYSYSATVNRTGYDVARGFSVRCLKD